MEDFDTIFATMFDATPTRQSAGDHTNTPITDGFPEDIEFTQLFFAEMLGGDPLAYERSTGAGDLICEKAQCDELQTRLIGQTDTIPAAPMPAPAPFPSALNKFLADFTSNFAAQFAKQAAAKPQATSDSGGRWVSMKHETAIRRIANRARAAGVFAPIRDSAFDGVWDRLVQSCIDHVRASVREAAEDAA